MGRATLTDEMVAALVCREMKWDWITYHEQPAWFITIIIEMLQQEAEANNRKNKG